MISGAAGAVGALIGELICEIFMDMGRGTGTFLNALIHVSIWTGIISLSIALGLIVAQNIYFKKAPFSISMIKAGIRGVLTGAFVGGMAQILFSFTSNISELIEISSRIFCWGIFGMGSGWGISLFVPNYPRRSAMIAGFIGGAIGGSFFRFTFSLFPGNVGRLIGVAVLGLFIGLMIAYIEELVREAWLTIIWSKKEKVIISLGSKPIVLGSSSEADVYLPKERNYPPVTAIIKLENSRITIENKINNQITELRNGSKLFIGSIEVVVNSKCD
jgi:Ca-activated chloride channel family protein